ncbi:flagellar hook-length control protein FliK [Dethiobacter alkaliphilus]|uniref:Flagellar hook-length control protein n=1 Tax=Dethiobacter alkaliphilus AHT 1 TaxID=555088 RepID=C0GJH7_DETAL|nr:flagellar hook-length control protein FliK [Dethiobacter alkaliphilus]EEG76524.1 flagellar hook-length control protein [Dethiobacter alkaliphilus AHT 1]
MEAGMLPLLAPLLKAQATAAGQNREEGAPQIGFAGLLAMLQQSEEFDPAQAMLGLQMAGKEEQDSAVLPYLVMALMPQLAGEQTDLEGMAEENHELDMYPDLLAFMAQAPVEQLLEVAVSSDALEASDVADKLVAVAEVPQAIMEEGAESLEPVGQKGNQAEKLASGMSMQDAKAVLQQDVEVAEGSDNEKNGAQLVRPVGERDSNILAAERLGANLAFKQVSGEDSSGVKSKNATELSSEHVQRPLVEHDPFRSLVQTASYNSDKAQVSRAAVVEQVLEKMLLVKEPQGESTLFVRLRPAVLGEVEVRLRMEEGRLVANILTENAQVKETLDGALNQLRQRLEAQQINVAEMTVTVNQEQSSRQGSGFHDFRQTQAGGGDVLPVEAVEEIPPSAVLIPGALDMRA